MEQQSWTGGERGNVLRGGWAPVSARDHPSPDCILAAHWLKWATSAPCRQRAYHAPGAQASVERQVSPAVRHLSVAALQDGGGWSRKAKLVPARQAPDQEVLVWLGVQESRNPGVLMTSPAAIAGPQGRGVQLALDPHMSAEPWSSPVAQNLNNGQPFNVWLPLGSCHYLTSTWPCSRPGPGQLRSGPSLSWRSLAVRSWLRGPWHSCTPRVTGGLATSWCWSLTLLPRQLHPWLRWWQAGSSVSLVLPGHSNLMRPWWPDLHRQWLNFVIGLGH